VSIKKRIRLKLGSSSGVSLVVFRQPTLPNANRLHISSRKSTAEIYTELSGNALHQILVSEFWTKRQIEQAFQEDDIFNEQITLLNYHY
jgi:hypothetical protein